MKGFEFLAIQSWKKYIDFKKTKGKNASTCLKEKKEETHEPPTYEIGEVEEVVHEEDQNSLPSDSEIDKDTSHKYEEVSIENTEDNFKTDSTLEMKRRASTDGCLKYEGVPTNGCSHLYVGDIEITFESVVASQNSIKHENEDLVAVEEETISTSPSPLDLHEVGPSKKEEDEEVHLQEPHFLEGSLKMNEKKIQRVMCNIKGNFMSLIFDRNQLFELNELLQDAYLKNN